MKTKSFNTFIAISLVVIVGGFVFFKDEFGRETANMADAPKLLMDTLNYVDYSEANLENAKIKGQPMLFFAATRWCQTCSELEKEIIERQTEIPSDMIILKVDYDNDKAMNAKWGVTSQHTLIVLDESGTEIKRWVGGNFDTMIKNINTI